MLLSGIFGEQINPYSPPLFSTPQGNAGLYSDAGSSADSSSGGWGSTLSNVFSDALKAFQISQTPQIYTAPQAGSTAAVQNQLAVAQSQAQAKAAQSQSLIITVVIIAVLVLGGYWLIKKL